MENTVPSKKLRPLFNNLTVDYSKNPRSLLKKRYKLVRSVVFEKKAEDNTRPPAKNNHLWNHFKHLRVIYKINLIKLQTEYGNMSLHNIHLLARKSLRVHSLHLPACNSPQTLLGNVVFLRTVNQLKYLHYGSPAALADIHYIDEDSPRSLVNALRRSRLEAFNMAIKCLLSIKNYPTLQCCRYPSTLKRLDLFWGAEWLNFSNILPSDGIALSHMKNLRELSMTTPYHVDLIERILDSTDLSKLTSLYIGRYQQTSQDFSLPYDKLRTMHNLKAFGLTSLNSSTQLVELFQALSGLSLKDLSIHITVSESQKEELECLTKFLNPFNAGLESLSIQLICKWSLRPDDLDNLNAFIEQIYELKLLRKLDLHLQSSSVEKRYTFYSLSKLFQESHLLNEVSLAFNFIEPLEFRDFLMLLQKTNPALTKFRLSAPILEVSEDFPISEAFLGKSNSLKTLELPGLDVCSIKSLERICDFVKVNKNLRRVEIGVIDAAVRREELSEFLGEYLPSKIRRDIKLFWSFQSGKNVIIWHRYFLNVKSRWKERYCFKVMQYCDLLSKRMGIFYIWNAKKAEKDSS